MKPRMDSKGQVVKRSICGSVDMLANATDNKKQKTQNIMRMKLKQLMMKHKTVNAFQAEASLESSVGLNLSNIKKIETRTSQRGSLKGTNAAVQD